MGKMLKGARTLALHAAETVRRHIFPLAYMLWMVLLSLAALAGINVYAKMALLIVLCFIFSIISLLHMDQEKKGHPLPESPKRFTHRNRDGAVEVRREDWEEAVIYLYEVEEHIKRNKYII